MKQTLMLKNPKTKLKIYKQYLVIQNPSGESIIGYRYIKALYLHKDISISISQCIKLASKVDVYFIDPYGYIIAKMELV